LDTEESRDECVREVRIHETTLRREIHADDPRLLVLAKRRVQPSAVLESGLTRGGTWGARVGAEAGCSSNRAGKQAFPVGSRTTHGPGATVMIPHVLPLNSASDRKVAGAKNARRKTA
jgi:hypothetical protein